MISMSQSPAVLTLPDDARVVLCDVWGVLHDGVAVFPDALTALDRWRAEGRIVVLVTNAPRPRAAIARQLDGLGLTADHYDALVSSGDTGLVMARAAGGRVGFLGAAHDRAALLAAGLDLGPVEGASVVVCAAFDGGRDTVESHEPELTAMRAAGARMLCLNPDRWALHAGVREPCAGLLADRYAGMGGEVVFTGKPFPPIYQRALALAAEARGTAVDPAEVVAVGDAVVTDLLGAATMGFRFVFVTQGIEAEEIAGSGIEAFLTTTRAAHGLPDFQPRAITDALR
jgi:HAD superfamily hydrolase (TIGR01459 family)